MLDSFENLGEEETIEYVIENLEVEQIVDTSALRLRCRLPDPADARIVTSNLISTYRDMLIDEQEDIAELEIGRAEERLKVLRSEIEQAKENRDGLRKKAGVDDQEIVLAKFEFAMNKLSQSKDELSKLTGILEQTRIVIESEDKAAIEEAVENLYQAGEIKPIGDQSEGFESAVVLNRYQSWAGERKEQLETEIDSLNTTIEKLEIRQSRISTAKLELADLDKQLDRWSEEVDSITSRVESSGEV